MRWAGNEQRGNQYIHFYITVRVLIKGRTPDETLVKEGRNKISGSSTRGRGNVVSTVRGLESALGPNVKEMENETDNSLALDMSILKLLARWPCQMGP